MQQFRSVLFFTFLFFFAGQVTSSRDSPFHTVTDRFTCQECGHERTQYRTWRRKAVVDRVSERERKANVSSGFLGEKK